MILLGEVKASLLRFLQIKIHYMNDKIKELQSYIQHLEKMLIGYKEVCKKKDETIDYYKTELDNLTCKK